MNSEQILTLTVGVIAALPGIFAILAQYSRSKSQSERDEADAAKLLTEAATSVVRTLKDEIARLEKRIQEQNEDRKKLQVEFEKAKEYNIKLEKWITKVEELEETIKNGE